MAVQVFLLRVITSWHRRNLAAAAVMAFGGLPGR